MGGGGGGWALAATARASRGGWARARGRLRERAGAGLLGSRPGLVEGQDLRVKRALLLPFWEFSTEIGFRFRAAPREGGAPGEWSAWESRRFCGRGARREARSFCGRGARLTATADAAGGGAPAMQVGATFALRRDLLEAAKPRAEGGWGVEMRRVEVGAASASRELGLGELELEWEPCEMRRGMAWQLALSHLRQELREEAVRRLREDAGPASSAFGGGGGGAPTRRPGPPATSTWTCAFTDARAAACTTPPISWSTSTGSASESAGASFPRCTRPS